MNRTTIAKLFATTASCVLALSGAAHAQSAQPTTLEEVVVTANRQVDTVHSVPLTVTAVTSKDIERQGLQTASDLSSIVPSLQISGANSAARGGTGVSGSAGVNASVAIRGISSTVSGAASTTGIYVDDVPLQQRTSLSPTGGGVAFPLLFDLDRVEVLKGPQGDLYGGSSEGGTIRFITPQPSLTKQSLYMKAQGSSTDGGDPSYLFGVSVNGPVVADRIAARVSATVSRDGGYIDHVSQFSGNILANGKNTNSASHEGINGQVLIKLTDRATATIGVLYQNEKYRDSDNFWINMPQYQANVGPFPFGQTYTYGPYNMFGPFRSGFNTNLGQNFYTSDSQIKPVLTPHSQSMALPSLTLDYAFDKVNLKSITAYTETKDHAIADTAYADVSGRGSSIHAPPIPQTVEGPFNALPANSPYIADVPVYNSLFVSSSVTDAFTEELRAASTTPDSRLSWVGGLFYENVKSSANGNIQANIADLTAGVLYGISQTTPNATAFTAPSSLNESQYAIYGEANYKLTDQLKATIGLRATRDDLKFSSLQGGSLFGFPAGVVVPGASGDISSTAVTPKFGLQYVVDPNTNFYAIVSQGFRPGGVNSIPSPVCSSAAMAAGYSSGIPASFNKDSLWSYEGGTKAKLFGGKATVNASLFYIDWSNVQTTINLGCGGTFSINASSEVSEGAEFEGSALLFPGFTASVRAGYTDAHFTSAVKSPSGIALINNGDVVPYTPKWQASLSGEYRFTLADHPAYVRADYSWQSGVLTDYGPGTVSYTPDAHALSSAQEINARAGVTVKRFDVSAFVENLTNSRDLLSEGGLSTGPGRYGCLNLSCSSYNKYSEGGVESTYRPRTIGVAVSYRY